MESRRKAKTATRALALDIEAEDLSYIQRQVDFAGDSLSEDRIEDPLVKALCSLYPEVYDRPELTSAEVADYDIPTIGDGRECGGDPEFLLIVRIFKRYLRLEELSLGGVRRFFDRLYFKMMLGNPDPKTRLRQFSLMVRVARNNSDLRWVLRHSSSRSYVDRFALFEYLDRDSVSNEDVLQVIEAVISINIDLTIECTRQLRELCDWLTVDDFLENRLSLHAQAVALHAIVLAYRSPPRALNIIACRAIEAGVFVRTPFGLRYSALALSRLNDHFVVDIENADCCGSKMKTLKCLSARAYENRILPKDYFDNMNVHINRTAEGVVDFRTFVYGHARR